MGVTSFFHGCLVLLIFSSILQAFVFHCPKDWMPYKDHCYKFFEDFLPWLQAEVDCIVSEKNSHLLSIPDETVMSKINEWLLPIQISQPIWIGLYNLKGGKRRWRWTDMSTSIYRNWNNLEDANNNRDKNCVMMAYTAGALKWYAENCSLPFNYVCEM
ncbi:C-type lectin-like [Pantherophis guttatus]|uniref:C-type lectin-like n=1 Tax=Pantherophis guttatus TaxID=94885 RepID=A0ABM3Z8M1_PANGU|nr:C-type lectin-like [Pantherophis guttatus]